MIHQYNFIDTLGQGGFGEVYLVKHKTNQSIYALKKIEVNMENINDIKFKLKEIKNLATIESQFIISYKKSYFDEYNSCLWILMEYGENGSLLEKIKENRESNQIFSEEEILSYLIQILIALKHLKNCNIIHRDLKPANIVFDKNNQIKITDFGLADVINDDIKKIFCGGTKFYISPETAYHSITDFKSDLWSLGCILFQLMTLKNSDFISYNFSLEYIKYEIKKIYEKKIYSEYLIFILCLLLTVDFNDRPDVEFFLNIPFIKEQINSDENILNKYKNNNIDSIKIPSNINNLNDYLPRKEIFNMNNYLNSKEDEDEKSYHENMKKSLLKIKKKIVEDQKKIWEDIKRENESKKRIILNDYLSKIKNTRYYDLYKERLMEQFKKRNLNEFQNFIEEIEADRKYEEKKMKKQMLIFKKEEEFIKTRNLFLMRTFTEEELRKEKNIQNLIVQNNENFKITIFNNNKKINVFKSTNKYKKIRLIVNNE